MKKEVVAVIGLGYVGLPLALLVDSKGYDVIGIDYDVRKVDSVNSGKSTFVDQEISTQLQARKLNAQNNYAGIEKAQVVIVCVPTPVDSEYMPDLGPVSSACTEISKNLVRGQLVIIESTINPGVCEEVILPILEKHSGLVCGRDFFLAHCPERINPGDEKWNVSNINRVVGGYDKKSLDLAVQFYESIIEASIKPMGSLKEAEAVKIVENSFRDINIAFVNELAMSFTKLGIDVVNVIDGAATKPFAFMAHYPGAGVGGHCIPVDPYYLIEYAKQNGFNHKFLAVAREINNAMPQFVIDQLKESFLDIGKKIEDSKVTVLGLSYKANVGDVRESPAIEIIKLLRKNHMQVAAYDPYVDTEEYAPKFHGSPKILIKNTLLHAVTGANAIIIATAHREFLSMDIQKIAELNVRAIIDGRNCLHKDEVIQTGMIYKGIGR